MIKTKEDLKFYIAEDAKQANEPVHPSIKKRIIDSFIHNYNRDFMICLRRLEYHTNNSGLYHKILSLWFSRRLGELRAKTGCELNINVAGPGLHLSHGKVVISAYAHIGEHCKILSDVTIGGQGRYDREGAPSLGNRIFVGTGAKIIGNISIADDVVIGANSVVTKSITESGTTWAGNPAKKVSENNSYHYLNRK